jgi:hypothetical protein
MLHGAEDALREISGNSECNMSQHQRELAKDIILEMAEKVGPDLGFEPRTHGFSILYKARFCVVFAPHVASVLHRKRANQGQIGFYSGGISPASRSEVHPSRAMIR